MFDPFFILRWSRPWKMTREQIKLQEGDLKLALKKLEESYPAIKELNDDQSNNV